MVWFFSKSKRHRLKVEAKHIDVEISRSKRFGFKFGVLAVELSHSTPRGLSKILPGKMISYYVLEKNLRSYDQIIESQSMRRYYIVLPQTDKDGVEVVKTRIYRIAKEKKWEDLSIKSAVYPDDGRTSKRLLRKVSLIENTI